MREHVKKWRRLSWAAVVNLTALLAWGMQTTLSCVQSARYTIIPGLAGIYPCSRQGKEKLSLRPAWARLFELPVYS